MKKLIILVAIGGTFVLTSCSGYSGVTGTTSKPIKTGEARGTMWFGIGNVDVGAGTAAKNGGITKIATVERAWKKGLISTTFITRVTGE